MFKTRIFFFEILDLCQRHYTITIQARRKTKIFVTNNVEEARLEAGFVSLFLEVVVWNLCWGQADLGRCWGHCSCVPGHGPWVCPHLPPWLAVPPPVTGAELSGTGCGAGTAALLWQFPGSWHLIACLNCSAHSLLCARHGSAFWNYELCTLLACQDRLYFLLHFLLYFLLYFFMFPTIVLDICLFSLSSYSQQPLWGLFAFSCLLVL